MGVSKNDGKWLEMFHLLEEFMEQERRLPSVSERYRGVALGNWVANQKAFYKKGKLSDNRKECWERFAFPDSRTTLDEINEQQWFSKFELLKEFLAKNGTLPTITVVFKDVHIGTWLSTQKCRFRKGMLSEDRKMLLEGIGVEFDVDRFEKQWNFNFDVLKLYVKENGSVPRFDVFYNGVNIGQWVVAQKHKHRKGKLSQDHQELLEGAGVDFSNDAVKARQDMWNERLGLLQEYVSLYGKLPRSDVEYKGVFIGLWLKEKTYAYNRGQLPDNRWALLCDFAEKYNVDLFDIERAPSKRSKCGDGRLDDLIGSAVAQKVNLAGRDCISNNKGFDHVR